MGRTNFESFAAFPALQEYAHPCISAISIKALASFLKSQHPQSHKAYWPLLVALHTLRKRKGLVPSGDRRVLPDISFPKGHPGRLDDTESGALVAALAGVKRKRVSGDSS